MEQACIFLVAGWYFCLLYVTHQRNTTSSERLDKHRDTVRKGGMDLSDDALLLYLDVQLSNARN